MTGWTGQRGFTLMELMIAGLVSVFLMTAALQLLLHGAQITSGLEGRFKVNSQARHTFAVLAGGGRGANGALGTDGTVNVYGLRGRNAPPASGLRQDYRFDYASNGLTLRGDEVATVTITCAGVGDPLPDCTAQGENHTVRGWVGEDVQLNSATRSVAGRTVETDFTLIDPYRVRRPGVPAAETRERFHSVFTLNRSDVDP